MRNISFVALVALTCGLLFMASAAEARNVTGLDGQTQLLEFSKSVPGQLNYQGFLANAADSSAVTVTLEMTFRLFDSETKGAELWAETHPSVEVSDGLFQVLLGSMTSFPSNLFTGNTLWLQTEIGAEILSPRKPLVSVAYSQMTENSDHASTADHAATADWAANAVEAQHAVHADTAAFSPSANAWTVSGGDVYRETGKVGIGTASPLTELDVNGSVNAATYYGDGSNLTGIGGTTDNDWTIDGADVYHQTGNVGIGTASPTAPLTIQAISGTDVQFSSSGSNVDVVAPVQFNIGTSSIQGLHLMTDGSARMSITGTGRVGIGISSPERLLHLVGENPRILIEASAVSPEVNFKNSDDAGPEIWALYKHGTTDDFRFYQSGDKVTIQNSTGYVGIGTTSPAAKLDVSGDVNTSSFYEIDGKTVLSTTDIQNTLVGDGAGANNTSDHETFVGYNAGYSNQGLENTFIGCAAGSSNTTGYFNTCLGHEAGYRNTTGYWNTFLGMSAGRFNETGLFNTFIGAGAGLWHTTGHTNTFLGTGTGYMNLAGSGNVFIGNGAGYWEDGSNKLYIANESDTSAVLIYGDFSSGKVGLGTMAPSTKLSVVHDATNFAHLTSTNFGIEAQSDWVGGKFTGGGSDGVRAYCSSISPVDGAVFASNTGGGNAGYFSGNVTVTGTMSKGGGSFKIDHPLDPENKYLYHSFVESPDMKNVYDGVVMLDSHGEASVDLPDWFDALNRDFRYQLTAIGAPGPDLYIAEKISGNRFKIAGGKPGMEVSWQVTGIRQDAFANAHRIPVEEDKPDEERGNYLYPREHGMAEKAGIDYQARLRKENK